MNTINRELVVSDLGLVPYSEATKLQEELRSKRQRELIPDTLLLLEHPPTYTLGRRSNPDDLSLSHDWYREQGIEIFQTKRGGKLTYHGPGQLVCYPIVQITDVLAFVRAIERTVIAALAKLDLPAYTRRELTGVWCGEPGSERKIGSIGLHVSRGVTMHGFAVNVNCDLTPFEWVNPCGLDDVKMTSLKEETNYEDIKELKQLMTDSFKAELY